MDHTQHTDRMENMDHTDHVDHLEHTEHMGQTSHTAHIAISDIPSQITPGKLQIELPITGMTCASCARTVERTLKKTEGIESANVNFATERASVAFDPAQVDVNTMIERIDKAGYGVAQATLELPITGMTCASCVRNVERALNK